MDIPKIKICETICTIENHEGLNLIGVCIDKSCKTVNKLVCSECIFDIHEQHKLIKLKNIEEKINETFRRNMLENQENMIEMRMKEIIQTVDQEVVKLTTNLIEIINTKKEKLLTNIQDNINEKRKKDLEGFDISILTKKSLWDMSPEESASFINFVNTNFSNKNLSQSNLVSEKSLMDHLNETDTNIKSHLAEMKKKITEYINEYLFVNAVVLPTINIKFEWSTKIYGSYQFYYTLLNNNLTAKKELQEGTITVVRSKEMLSPGNNYLIEFLVEFKKLGDYDIGIGSDSVGNSCWLRAKGCVGITNMGVYNDGKIVDSSFKLSDGDYIIFEVNLRNKENKFVKITKNKTISKEYKINLVDIYVLSAIRNAENAVTITKYYIS